jgi:RNA polymerase sigma factor (sigma-70 family)
MTRNLISILRHLQRVVGHQADGGLSDAQLLERFARYRDEAAFEVLVWRHGPMVLSVARRILGNGHDAEDVLQATFLVLVRQAHSIGRGAALGAWLHKVAYRTALQARKQRRKTAAEPLADATAPEPPSEHGAHEALVLLDQETHRLPAKYRTLLVLSYFQGMTNREIATELGCPIGTVFTRLARGREMLRARLERRGITSSSGIFTAVLAQAGPAPLSAKFVKTTVGAALAFAAGSTAGISPHAGALTEGVLKMMGLRQKLIAAVLVFLAVGGSGAGLLALRPTVPERDDAKKEASTEHKSAPEARVPPREALRYDGKSFEDWHMLLMTELKPESRVEAIKALSAFGANGYAREAAAAIVEVLRNYDMWGDPGPAEDKQVVDAGNLGLHKIGPEAVVPVLIEEFKKGRRNGQLLAFYCLLSLPVESTNAAVPAVTNALKDKDPRIRRRALETLRTIDREGISAPAVAAVISDPSPIVRRWAIEVLSSFGPKAAAAIPQLLAASTKDDDADSRRLALGALCAIKASAKTILPALKQALKDKDPQVREQAIFILGSLGTNAEEAVPDLVAALKTTEQGKVTERVFIARALGDIGPPAKGAIQALTEALKPAQTNGQSGLVNAITEALGKINK